MTEEQGEFRKLPSGIYDTNYIRQYAASKQCFDKGERPGLQKPINLITNFHYPLTACAPRSAQDSLGLRGCKPYPGLVGGIRQ